ncbi:putative protein N(5)-glutamine methyltransferase [Nocardiopsis potens]|uniref:putative protein N(5)-glutamine methyltransferase n=1 Tax=Nocardiopsis potens TaxID=1246458 RepID=UPI000377F1C7|nr:putative protein N(5)-glutamine methyltransferase [Nocardiopsis potens]
MAATAERLRAAGCVFAEDEALLLVAAAGTPELLDSLVERRSAGLPLEHLLGWAEFAGLRITVGPGVFVPRRRTEFLAARAAALLRPGGTAVDLCCGSGAVGAALLAAVDGAEVHAADIDPVAVDCARRNLDGAGGVHLGDLFDALPGRLRGRIDVVAANAPYVPTGAIGTLPPEARDHEPLATLDGGADGLDVQRRVAAAAPDWLRPGGALLIETSTPQALMTCDIVARAGLLPQTVEDGELDATAVIGILP